MDDFTVYGQTFQEDISNLEKVLKICKETNLSIINGKYHMLLTEGVVLAHHIFSVGLKVDPAKIEVTTNIPVPKSHQNVRKGLICEKY